MLIRPNTLAYALISTMVVLATMATPAHAKDNIFHSEKFDITINKNIKLLSKSEKKEDGFYRYVFGSANNDELQMRVIVSDKQPEPNQSLDAFQTDTLSSMSVMLMDSYGLYQFVNSPENKTVLDSPPEKIKIGEYTYSSIHMFFGDLDAAFLITNANNMTYAFTLLSKDANKAIRTENLQAMERQLETIKLK